MLPFVSSKPALMIVSPWLSIIPCLLELTLLKITDVPVLWLLPFLIVIVPFAPFEIDASVESVLTKSILPPLVTSSKF